MAKQQYKLVCCGRIVKHEICTGDKCPYCGVDSPHCQEVDKEDMVIVVHNNYSGDKKFEERPWGSFAVFIDEQSVKVKKIVVKPQCRLSLQLHRKRQEDWVIVSGSGTMQIGNKEFDITTGDHVHINKYDVHRVSNGGLIDLVIIEVQTGMCQEDDITRIEDDYGRLEDINIQSESQKLQSGLYE